MGGSNKNSNHRKMKLYKTRQIAKIDSFQQRNIYVNYMVLEKSYVTHDCLFFSSPELKAQVSISDRPLSGVRLSVRL
jgi:hypothetical protein